MTSGSFAPTILHRLFKSMCIAVPVLVAAGCGSGSVGPPVPYAQPSSTMASVPVESSTQRTEESTTSGCYQCTSYVAKLTAINFRSCWNGAQYGDAGFWVAHAKSCRFGTSATPVAGSIFEVMLKNPGPGHYGHVGLVKSSSYNPRTRRYTLHITDANYWNDCKVRDDVTAVYDTATNTLNLGSAWWYAANGFITSWRR